MPRKYTVLMHTCTIYNIICLETHMLLQQSYALKPIGTIPCHENDGRRKKCVQKYKKKTRNSRYTY